MRPTPRLRWLTLARCAVVLAAGVAGCARNEPTYSAAGEVVYKDTGEPVASTLTIYFESTKPPYVRSSGLVEDGKFYTSTLSDNSGSIAGEHRVRFDQGRPGGGVAGPGGLIPIMDPKYADFGSSGIIVNVEPGARNLFRIEVERGPKGPRPGQKPKITAPAEPVAPPEDSK